MLFNSFTYILFFLPITVAVYFLLQRIGSRNLPTFWLVAASLFFYGYWEPSYVPIILGSMLFNFIVGRRLLSAFETGAAEDTKTRVTLIFGIACNLALLGYFKYADFFIGNINAAFGSEIALLRLVLPLGISFFTFQQISYLVDCRKGLARVYRFPTFALFVTFFPQLVAGPIVHHREMMPQFERKENHSPNADNIALGLTIFGIGLFKKAVLADTFALFASGGYAATHALSTVEAWTTSLAYTFQLYFDFSGYTDLGIGSALMLNIRLPQNFNAPYRALDIRDFWQRWHMTLSRFLKNYLYIPLGGNRHGRLRTHFNLFITFLLGGFWHGAGWTFIIWGALHGAANAIWREWKQLKKPLPKWLGWFITFQFVNVAWVFFRAESVDKAFAILGGMVGLNGFYSWRAFGDVGNTNTAIAALAALLALGMTAFGRPSHDLPETFKPSVVRLASLVLMLAAGLFFLNSSLPKEFLYFDF